MLMIPYSRTLYLLLLVFFYISCSQKQTNGSIIKITSQNKGENSLEGPKSISRNIIQDKKGIIWIATFSGIYSYDGKYFTNITSKVIPARFFSILEDQHGKFWFGTIGSGVYCYDGKSFQNFTTQNGLLNNEVTSIYEDKKGIIWLGVSGGLSRYDGQSFKNYIIDKDKMIDDLSGKTFSNRQPFEINAILEDRHGKFWFASRDYTYLYDGKTFSIFSHNNLPFKNVRTIIEDRKGNIWLGGSDGLWRYKNGTFTQFNKKFVGYIMEDKEGNIWTSAETNSKPTWSILRYDSNSLTTTKPTVSEIQSGEKAFFGIFEARDGNIWFGALSGVYCYNGKTITKF